MFVSRIVEPFWKRPARFVSNSAAFNLDSLQLESPLGVSLPRRATTMFHSRCE
jgi:hypothetical protein